jgi:hypothetical protein
MADLLEPAANMFGRDAHIAHDQIRPAKHARVYALQDKVSFNFRILPSVNGHQKRVVYIAVAE